MKLIKNIQNSITKFKTTVWWKKITFFKYKKTFKIFLKSTHLTNYCNNMHNIVLFNMYFFYYSGKSGPPNVVKPETSSRILYFFFLRPLCHRNAFLGLSAFFLLTQLSPVTWFFEVDRCRAIPILRIFCFEYLHSFSCTTATTVFY